MATATRNRSNWQGTQLALAIWGCLCWVGVSRAADAEARPCIDCHVHLWDTRRPEGIAWIAPDNKVLNRSFLPEHHEPLAKLNGIQGIVVVQAGQSMPDNQWNLDITAHNKKLYRGVVGNLSKVIGTADFQVNFAQLCRDKRYVGYRLSGRYQEKLTDAFFQDLQATAEQGRTLDLLIGQYTLEDAAEVARRVPKLKIILDHFGNVQLDGQPLSPAWVEQFRSVAKSENVCCKVSALYGRVKQQPAPQKLEFYKPILDLAWECFGEDRLIYGSDWPVTETTGDYASVLALTQAYFADKGQQVKDKVFSRNAIRFYNLSE